MSIDNKNKRGCTISSGRLLGLYLTTFSKGVLGLEASVELSKNILQTNQPTNRPTDISLYRSSLPELKNRLKKKLSAFFFLKASLIEFWFFLSGGGVA